MFFVIYFDLDDFIIVYVFLLQVLAFRFLILKEDFFNINLIIYFALSTFIVIQLILYTYQYISITSYRIEINDFNTIFLIMILPIVFYSVSRLQMQFIKNSSFSFRFSLVFLNSILVLVVSVINLFRFFTKDFPKESTITMIYSFSLAFIVLILGVLGLYLINRQHKRFQLIQDEINQLNLDRFDVERAKHNTNNILFTIHFLLKEHRIKELMDYINDLGMEG